MNIASLSEQLTYFLIFAISLISLISISIFVNSSENSGNYTVTSWITLGFNICSLLLSLSLFKKAKKDQEKGNSYLFRQLLLLSMIMYQIISTQLALNALPWGAFAQPQFIAFSKGEFFYTTFVIISTFYPYLALLLIIIVLQGQGQQFIALKSFAMGWLILWSCFNFIACCVSIKSFYVYQYAISDFKILNCFLLAFDLIAMASSIICLIKKNIYTLTFTLLLAITQFICVSQLSYMLPTLEYFFNSSEWTFLQVANYSCYGVVPIVIFILILLFFYNSSEEETEKQSSTEKMIFSIVFLIAILHFLAISIYLGIYKTVKKDYYLWDFPSYDSNYKGYCGSIIAICILLFFCAICSLFQLNEKIKSVTSIGILLGSTSIVALTALKQNSAFEQNIWGIFCDFAAQLGEYPKWYEFSKERSLLHTWDFTHAMGMIATATYSSIYLFIILYLKKKLESVVLLRNALYSFQLLIAALSLIAFAILQSKIQIYSSTSFIIIMCFQMILTGFLVIITLEHFLLSKSSSQIVSLETILTGLAILTLSILQLAQQPQVPSFQKEYNFANVMRNLLISFLPLQLISEITNLIKVDENETEDKLEGEKEQFLS